MDAGAESGRKERIRDEEKVAAQDSFLQRCVVIPKRSAPSSMGIPGMLTFLRGQGTIKKREFCHSARARHNTGADQPIGPGLVFDSQTLIELLLQEWAKLPMAHPLRFDHARGGQVTQFRAFSGHYLKQLVEEYQCTIAWVRDAGVNDKPATIPQWIYEFVQSTCPLTDQAVQSGESNHYTSTTDIISDLYLLETKEDDFLQGAVKDVRLGSSLLVIDAPANSADAEVWRQAQRMAATRKTFIISCDTDMFFFADISRCNVGIVLYYDRERTYESHNSKPKVETIDDQWSCDLGGDVSSRCLRFKFCFVEDVASECNVEAKYLPVLGACLGGDLGMHNGDYHEFTVRLKAALLQRHFKTPAVIAAFKQPEGGLRQQLHAVAKASMQGRLGSTNCIHGEFCWRASCERVHPAKGNLRCKYEKLPEGKCPNPCCRMRHTRPIGFRIAASTVDRFEGHEFLKSVVFHTWGEAVRAVSNIVNERKHVSHGIGPYMPPGAGLSFSHHFWSKILRLTCELIRTHSRNWGGTDGEVGIKTYARDLCVWLGGISDFGGNGSTEALIIAIETYSPLPLDQPLVPVELWAPNQKLETWRMRKFYRTSPYPLPSDAGNLNWITEHLRQKIGRKLGITVFVEGLQVGNKYVVKKVVCDEALEAESKQPPLIHGTRSRPSITLLEALELKRETDDNWLQDLETILQALPGPLLPESARKNSPDFHHVEGSYPILVGDADDDTLVPANSTVENLDSVVTGVLKIAILSITLWQRTLSSSQAQKPDSASKVAHEKVEALALWEMRAFIGSTILGWIQLQRKECPFDLLAGTPESGEDDGADFLFWSTPADLRRRAFVLTAQFLDVVNDVKHMTTMCCPGQDHLLQGLIELFNRAITARPNRTCLSTAGLREVCLNPEAVFSLYTAGGRAKPEHERDLRVRLKLVAIFNTGERISSARYAEVCDQLVDHVMDERSNNFDDLATADDWEDLPQF